MSGSRLCPECKQSVAISASVCPTCGFPLQVQPSVPVFQEAETGLPELWNPNAAASWSILFTPAFGAYLHALNWRVLGKPERAAANMTYVWVTIIFLVVNIGTLFLKLPEFMQTVMRIISLCLLLSWYLGQGKPQIEYVKSACGNRYNKRSWGLPLLSGISAIVAYCFVAVALALVLGSSPLSPDEIAAQVKPLILQEWQKKPELNGASIENISLVHKDSKNYVGTIEATIAGKPEHYVLEVTQDGQKLFWQVKLPGN